MSNLANADNDPCLATEQEIRAAYARVAKGESLQGELQPLVGAFVAHLRMLNLPPEQVLIRLKHILGEQPRVTRDPYAIDVRPTLNAQLVRWCIEEYYRART